MAGKSSVSLDTLVSAVLLSIGDEQNKRFEVKATQWVIDAIRRIHVNLSYYYLEKRLYFDNEDIFTILYPKDTVKILSVGMYRNDEFWPFTRKPNMSILATEAGATENFDYEANEGLAVPPMGIAYGGQANNTAYWVDDPQQWRVMVRMFSYYRTMTAWQDRTAWLKDKGVIVRYKSTGIDCSGDVCVPVEARDLIVAKVTYEFARRGLGLVMSGGMIQLQQLEVDNLQQEYESLLYEPSNFWEIKDSIYGSLNTTARR
jgi:hypothetical protein